MWQIYGQDHILRQLEPALKTGRLAHAYLLVGPPHIGKMTLALNLAQSVNCLQGSGLPCGSCLQCTPIADGHHADVRIVAVDRSNTEGPTRTVIGINDVKEVLHQVNLKPYEGSWIVIIFDGAESMSEKAANALLKTLEEPPPQVMFLLLTANEDALPSTIRSRCRRLALLPVPMEQMVERLMADHQAQCEEAEGLARLARGCLGWAIAALSDPQILKQREAELEQLQEVCGAGAGVRFGYAADLAGLFSRDRESAAQTLYLWLGWWHDLLLIKEGAQEFVRNTNQLTELNLQAAQLNTVQTVHFIRRLVQTLEALESNANPRLALEALMLSLPALKAQV